MPFPRRVTRPLAAVAFGCGLLGSAAAGPAGHPVAGTPTATRTPASRPPAATPAPVRATRNEVLPAPAGAAAEPNVAIDPHNPRRMAVAGNPYLAPTRIQVATSDDAGQHWSAAMNILPPGARKSYDPQLGFAADGSLLVTGGASPDTRPGCQRSSEVFIAALHGTQIDYHVLATASGGGLLDRPTLLVTPAERPVLVAWTASPGPGAECLLRPVSSTTVVARLTPQLGVQSVSPLPRVARAPFGSDLAVSGQGVLGLVVAGRDGADGVAVQVYQSRDGTHWTVSQAGKGRAEPDRLSGLGGAVLSMPSIAGLPHGFVVAWTDTTTGTERTLIARDDGGGWQQTAPPPAAAGRLLPTVAVADGGLVLLQAGLGPTGLSFYTWQQVGSTWFALANDGGGTASDRHEVGEVLGLAVGPDGSRVTAVPVDLPGSSALLVRTQLPPAPAAARGTGTAKAANPTHASGAGLGPGSEVLLGATAGLVLLVTLRRSRVRHRRRRYR